MFSPQYFVIAAAIGVVGLIALGVVAAITIHKTKYEQPLDGSDFAGLIITGAIIIVASIFWAFTLIPVLAIGAVAGAYKGTKYFMGRQQRRIDEEERVARVALMQEQAIEATKTWM